MVDYREKHALTTGSQPRVAKPSSCLNAIAVLLLLGGSPARKTLARDGATQGAKIGSGRSAISASCTGVDDFREAARFDAGRAIPCR